MSILSKAIAIAALFDLQVSSFSTPWVMRTTFKAQDIGAGGNKIWATGMNQGIYEQVNNQWVRRPGAAVRVAVNGDGNPYVVNNGHGIYKWINNNWTRLPGAAWDVGVSPANDLWVIGTNVVPGGYGIYNWNTATNNWTNIPGGAVRIAVGPSGPWVVNSAGSIFERVGNAWQNRPGCAHDVGVGADNVTWVIGCDNVGGGHGIYRWNGTGWNKSSGGATNISVTRLGQPVVSNSAGYTYWPTHFSANLGAVSVPWAQ